MAGSRGWSEYWRDESRGLEAVHARFRGHVFAPHSHDSYSFGVTDAGARQFHCRDERLRAVILSAQLRGTARTPVVRTLTDRAQRGAAHRARTLMREAYPKPLLVELLADAAGCSRFAFYRAFSAEFGMSPRDCERQLRLRHARSLLAAGTAPAEAAATGFADQAHLARWFKRSYGITPGVYAHGARH